MIWVVVILCLIILMALIAWKLRPKPLPPFERDPTMPLAVVFRPKYELATNYSHYTLGLAVSDLSGLGFQVYDLRGPSATRSNLISAIENYRPDLVVADGHGAPRVLTGQDGEPVLEACVNDEVMSTKVFAAISCLTGQSLGPSSREKNAQAYGGFVNEFTWVVTPPYDPATDPCWTPFQDVIRTIIVLAAKYRLTRVSFKDVYQGVIDRFNHWLDYYGFGPGALDPNAADIYMWLNHDKSGFVWIGEEVYAAPTIPLGTILPLGFGLVMGLGTIVFPEVGR